MNIHTVPWKCSVLTTSFLFPGYGGRLLFLGSHIVRLGSCDWILVCGDMERRDIFLCILGICGNLNFYSFEAVKKGVYDNKFAKCKQTRYLRHLTWIRLRCDALIVLRKWNQDFFVTAALYSLWSEISPTHPQIRN